MRAAILLFAALLTGCVHHHIAAPPPGDRVEWWDGQTFDQCVTQPELDWCHHAK